jgi:hypothetical protein
VQVHHKPTKILIVGKSGSGKTTYELRYVRNSGHATVFIFDHKQEFEEREGIPASISIDECTERLTKGEKFISYHYAHEFPGDAENAFQFFCEWVYEICKALRDDGKERLFACDEVNRFTGTGDMGWAFRQLIEDGRLQGLDFVGTSHAANQIHNRLRLQLSEIVALRTLDPRPLAFLQENGFPVEEIKALPTGAFIAKDLDTDTFTRGKLFSCASSKEEVEPAKEPDDVAPSDPEPTPPPSPTEKHALSRSP